MPNPAVPYHLKPKDTRLPAGHDDSLDPAAPPTDPARRGVSLLDWVRTDASPGPVGAPDAPAGAPATDPMVRSLSPFEWGKIDAFLKQANAPVRETVPPTETLDPDLAMWPAIYLTITPFSSSPSTGVWPKGWVTVDANAQMWVCTEAGEPGTWAEIGFVSAGVASFNTRTGAVVLELADVQATDYVPDPSGAGDVLTSTGEAQGDWEWSAAALVSDAAVLAEDYTVTGSLATFLTTASLAAGTWLVTFNATLNLQDGSTTGLLIAEGTATATFAGPQATELIPNTASIYVPAGFTTLVTVTEPGTLVFQAVVAGADAIVLSEGYSDQPDVTGYTAVKIA